MPYAATYHQPQRNIPWQNAQPVYSNIGARGSSLYNPCIRTPLAPANAFNNQLSYPTQQSPSQYEGPSSNHRLMPVHNLTQSAPYNPHPGYLPTNEHYTSQQWNGPGQPNTQPRPHPQSLPEEAVERQVVAPVVAATVHNNYGVQMETHAGRESSMGHRPCSTEKDSKCPRPPRTRTWAAGSSNTTTEGGAIPDQLDSAMEQLPMTHTNNSPIGLSTNSSKSSPPYTSSQRKQLRVEEKWYLKEVKRSIAEGRVPQVRLQQDNIGNIVQYKSQFLNALKLAALAIVPNADIDIKDPNTMEEIMEEVKRQFIIEKPLPEGMVGGFLQRLYKRNRAVYHRHWILHGDHSKPDDCASAAWLQLVDYWNSTEGSKECERNKANASSKKGTTVHFHSLTC